MSKTKTFLLGMIAGAALFHTLMNFHIVRTDSGVHLVRKVNVGLANPYADIRDFTIHDWREHPEIAMALVKNKDTKAPMQRVREFTNSLMPTTMESQPTTTLLVESDQPPRSVMLGNMLTPQMPRR